MNRRSILKQITALAAAAAFWPHAAHAEMAASVDEPVTITFYNYNLAAANAGADATREMIAEFERLHPNIKVEALPVVVSDIFTRIQADIVAGQQPDVAQLPFRDLIYLAEEIGANALEDMVPEAELNEHLSPLIPQGLELGRYNGKTYGLAYTFSTPILYYNADLFRAAGLDPDKPPRTWDEVEAAGIAIAQKAGKHGFFPGAYGPVDGSFVYQAIIMSNGGNVRDGNRVTFGEGEAAEAVAKLRRMVDNGAHARIDVGSHADTMASGNLGMFLYTSALMASLQNSAKDKFELRVAAMPAFGDKPTKPTNSGSALFNFSKDPVKQRASYELLKFLTGKYAYTIITSKIGYLPLRTDILDDPQYLGEWVKRNPMIQPNLEQLDRLTANVAFPGPDYRQVERIMMDGVREAIFGTDDPLEVLAIAQEQAQALMPQD